MPGRSIGSSKETRWPHDTLANDLSGRGLARGRTLNNSRTGETADVPPQDTV